MSEALRKVLTDHTNELRKDTAELLTSFAISHKEMGLFLRKELTDYNDGMRKDTAELMNAIAAAHRAMCAQLSAAMDTAEKARLQAEKNRLQETAAEILQRRDYLFELLDLDCGARTEPIVTPPTKTVSNTPTPNTIVTPAPEKMAEPSVTQADPIPTASAQTE